MTFSAAISRAELANRVPPRCAARASLQARPARPTAPGSRYGRSASSGPLAPGVCRVATAIHRDSVPKMERLRTQQQFHDAVEDGGSGLVVLTVGSNTCHNCEILNQHLAEDMCYEFLNVKFYRMMGDETRDNYELVKAWGTTALPEVRVYYNGELLETMVTSDVAEIHKRLENHLCEKLDICNSSDIDF